MATNFKKRNRAITILAIVTGALSLIIPIGLSIYYTLEQAERRQFDRLEIIAEEILRRSLITADQFFKATASISSSPPAFCSEEHIAKMREVAVSSSYLSFVGAMRNNRIMCSSMGSLGKGIDLGPAETAALGARLWIGITIPSITGQQPVNVYEKHGIAVIAHPGLVLDILDKHPEISAATVLRNPTRITRNRGYMNPSWIEHLDAQKTIADNHFLLTKKTGISEVIVAEPKSSASADIKLLAFKTIPIGILFGTLFAAAIFFLTKQSLSFKSELIGAIKKREFYLLYQPIFDLRNCKCIGVEALIRWEQADGTMVRPDTFIPFAEDNGLIRKISREVFRMVGEDAEIILSNDQNLHIGINLSAEDLHSEETLVLLKDTLQHKKINPNNIIIEATERSFIDAARARSIIQQIRNFGIKIAIDDFGTGYSSLSSLETHPLDYLKIDKSFVDTMQSDSATSKVAPHIIEIAKSLNLTMIAEGIETKEQLFALQALGVELGQGWLFGKPMSATEFSEFFNRKNQLPLSVSEH